MKSVAYHLITSLVPGLWLAGTVATAQEERGTADVHRLARLQVD